MRTIPAAKIMQRAFVAMLATLVLGALAPLHAQPPLQPIAFEDVTPEGLLKARAELALDHLHSD
jgi:hypothetical protein